MKIPDKIVGKNKLRDLAICEMYIDGKSPDEIVEILAKRTRPIKVRRVQLIIYNNADYVNPKIGWPKAKRLQRLQRLANKVEGKLHKEDELMVLEQIRKEMEGDKSAVDMSTHHHVTFIRHDKATKEEDERTKNRIKL